jgi:hypothetical protein
VSVGVDCFKQRNTARRAGAREEVSIPASSNVVQAKHCNKRRTGRAMGRSGRYERRYR